MNQAILDKIRKVEPYVPGEQPKERVIKLNTNENPYPPAPGVAKVRIRQQISWWKNCPGFIVSGRSRFL